MLPKFTRGCVLKMLKLSSNVSDAFPKVLKLSSEVSRCKPLMIGLTLGALWNKRCTWWVTIPVAAAVRCAGIFASLAVSSAILRENVMALLVTQMYGLLDQIAANIGGVNANRLRSFPRYFKWRSPILE
jgi:hypothetical protein